MDGVEKDLGMGGGGGGVHEEMTEKGVDCFEDCGGKGELKIGVVQTVRVCRYSSLDCRHTVLVRKVGRTGGLS